MGDRLILPEESKLRSEGLGKGTIRRMSVVEYVIENVRVMFD